jgi:acyl carrier protein
MEEFIVAFKSIFDDGIAEEITPDTEFRYLDGWTSLTALTFISEMQNIYGKTVSPLEMKKTETIKELYDFIISL